MPRRLTTQLHEDDVALAGCGTTNRAMVVTWLGTLTCTVSDNVLFAVHGLNCFTVGYGHVRDVKVDTTSPEYSELRSFFPRTVRNLNRTGRIRKPQR